ncbi:MAG: 3',5'-nucleoside bisphosphate phosphatase [Burkholderiales bacterium]
MAPQLYYQIVPLLNFDLHSHSTISDGTLAPAELVRRAASSGVEALALTDHDNVSGLDEARNEAQKLGILFINGVEISVSWEKTTLHIVGLGIDPDDSELIAGLHGIRAGRHARAQLMAADLQRVGLPDVLQGAYSYANNRDMIGRAHFARYMAEQGMVADVKSAFKKYLVKGKPGFVPHQWATLADTVSWIRGAGGIAVVAHPGRYDISSAAMRRLLAEFKSLGGGAIEVVTGNHTKDQAGQYAALAREFSLAASRGSDYHGPGESYTEPGRLPNLPADLTAVWDAHPIINFK